MKRWLSSCALALAIVITTGASTEALIFNYGNFVGTNVTYQNVTEDTHSSPMPLFGPPAIQGGDLMDFDPPSFTAAAGPGNPSTTTEGDLTFAIQSNSNSFGISQFVISEAGDFTIIGFSPAGGQATVWTEVRYNVTHVNGNALPASCNGIGLMTFTPVGSGGNGIYQSPSDNGTALPWQGQFSADITALLASCNVSGLATRVEVAVNNELTANSINGGSAFIAKKDFSGIAIMIPEPASATLAIGLLTILGLVGRNSFRSLPFLL